MSSTMTSLFFFMSAFCAMSMQVPGANLDNINMDDFDEAIGEEDCFGDNCGTASSGLSMLQSRSPKTAAFEERKAAAASVAAQPVSPEEPAVLNDMPPMDDLADAFSAESEDHLEAAALNLVQTGASVERVSVSDQAPMAVVAQADGSFEMNPHTVAAAGDGSMVFSVDSHASFHQEEGLSLVQTEAHIEHKNAPTETFEVLTPSALKVKKMEILADMELEDKETESLSLMQTDTSFAHKSAGISVQADGSLEINPKEQVVPSNGMMQFSVDVTGNFHSEEGFSLMQTDARVEDSTPAAPAATVAAVEEVHPHWTAEASSEEAISLIQSDASIERSTVNADGTLEMKTKKAPVSSSGVMHLSVNGHGQFHYEI